jgi:hypothetical protein
MPTSVVAAVVTAGALVVATAVGAPAYFFHASLSPLAAQLMLQMPTLTPSSPKGAELLIEESSQQQQLVVTSSGSPMKVHPSPRRGGGLDIWSSAPEDRI